MCNLCDVKASALHISVSDEKSQAIADRIGYILVRDGIPRASLVRAINLDPDLPYYEQPDKKPFDIVIEVADFLGVSVDWLITGKGRNTRPSDSISERYDRSAAIKDNQAETINVYNFSN